MMTTPSKVIRLTVPIPAELSERLSVLAWYLDLTRSQYVRRALAEYMTDRIAGSARLSLKDGAQWYADTRARWLARGGNTAALDTDAAPVADWSHGAKGA